MQKKGDIICVAGWGNEGKSFIFTDNLKEQCGLSSKPGIMSCCFKIGITSNPPTRFQNVQWPRGSRPLLWPPDSKIVLLDNALLPTSPLPLEAHDLQLLEAFHTRRGKMTETQLSMLRSRLNIRFSEGWSIGRGIYILTRTNAQVLRA